MDYAHFGSKPNGEVILSTVDAMGAMIPVFKIAGDGRMFLNRSGVWKEVAIVDDVITNAVLTDKVVTV